MLGFPLFLELYWRNDTNFAKVIPSFEILTLVESDI